jgi:DNA segregation ATPase FtsK/SpoIIIE-like protein
MRYQLDQIQKTLMAMQNVSIAPQETVAELMPGDLQAQTLPEYVDLLSLTEKQPVTLDSLIVGVALDEQGKQFVIRKSIHDLMHLMAISITGAGKSSWVLSFLAEIAMVQEPIEVVCIDVHGSAFNILRDWNKLRFPVARDNKQAVGLLTKVFEEADRRKLLYEDVPMADNITTYNQYTEGDKLVPWLVVIDEGTIMLSDKAVSEYVARAVQGTRQYGMYCFMTGQTAKASVVSTPIRDNFPTRIAFNNEPVSQRVVLGCAPPGQLEELPGRGWVRLKGKNVPLKMQAPYIRRQAFKDLIQCGGPANDMPIEGEFVDIDAEIKKVADGLDKVSISTVCRELGRPTGGEAFYKVRDSLEKQGLI